MLPDCPRSPLPLPFSSFFIRKHRDPVKKTGQMCPRVTWRQSLRPGSLSVSIAGSASPPPTPALRLPKSPCRGCCPWTPPCAHCRGRLPGPQDLDSTWSSIGGTSELFPYQSLATLSPHCPRGAHSYISMHPASRPPHDFPAGLPGVGAWIKDLNADLCLRDKDWRRETRIIIFSVRASLATI